MEWPLRTLGVEHEAAVDGVARGEQHVEKDHAKVGDAEGKAVLCACGGENDHD